MSSGVAGNVVSASNFPAKMQPYVEVKDSPRSSTNGTTAGCIAMYHHSMNKSVRVYLKFSKDRSVLDSQLHKLQAFDLDSFTHNKFVRAYAVLPPEAVYGLPENSVWKGAHCLVQECGHRDLGDHLQKLREKGGGGPDGDRV